MNTMSMNGLMRMSGVTHAIAAAGRQLQGMLARVQEDGGLTIEQYTRYLSVQYHLTNGVQLVFTRLAAHPCMRGKRSLREFLTGFAWEEEMHYELARRDLERLGRAVLPCPLDTRVWWAFFETVVAERPFLRLGATCVLENLGSQGGTAVRDMIAAAPFLDAHNTRFIELHLHETLPHGVQVLQALGRVPLQADELADLEEGARTGAVLFLRQIAWAFGHDDLARAFEESDAPWRPEELAEGRELPAA